MSSKQEKRRSLAVKVEDLDFDNLFVGPPPSYLTKTVAEKQKTEKDKLNEIDFVFADMRLEMNNLGAKSFQTTCPHCSKPIEKKDNTLSAAGKRFHSSCFRCSHCNDNIGESPYIEHAGKIYCLRDHAKLFGSTCKSCGKIITNKVVFALDATWHSECLKCSACSNVIGAGFIEKDRKVYCRADYVKLFSAPCGSCGKAIDGEFLETLGKKWHTACYNCQVCHKPFGEKSFPFNGLPYCEYHFHQKNQTLCDRCDKPINGACIRAFDKAFHAQCFRCETCHQPITTEFFPINGKAYCLAHGS